MEIDEPIGVEQQQIRRAPRDVITDILRHSHDELRSVLKKKVETAERKVRMLKLELQEAEKENRKATNILRQWD